MIILDTAVLLLAFVYQAEILEVKGKIIDFVEHNYDIIYS